MKTIEPTADAAGFLEALLWAYPEDDDGKNPMEGKTIFDFTPEFTSAVNEFCQAFRERCGEVPEGPRSFGGNVYFSLSGHGVGFWDSGETEHLQEKLEAFAARKYQFEGIDLSEKPDGKLDLAIVPEHIEAYRAKMFAHN